MRGITYSLCGLLLLSGCGGGGGATVDSSGGGGGSGTAEIESISLAPSPLNLAVGLSQQFTVTGTYSDGTTSAVTSGLTWSSSNAATAPVTPAGSTTGGAVGSAAISATHTDTGFTSTSAVTVTQPSAATYWKTNEITVPPATTIGMLLPVTVPASSAIGVVLQGTNSNFKMIDHGVYLLFGGNPAFITDPNGIRAPLSFNFIDVNGDGINDSGGSLLFDNETTALFFPNNGSVGTLPSGTYTFPIASWNAAGNALQSDTLQPYVYYKTVDAKKAVLNLNIFVISGVGGLTTQGNAAKDPEILGAIAKLRAVFESNPNVDITLNIAVDIVPGSNFADIGTQGEWEILNSGNPAAPTHDAMNIFIVSTMSFKSPGVIGSASRIPGPFNRQGTIQSGTLAEYQGDGSGTLLGQILAHEFGHYLGLYHTSQTNSAQDGIIGFDPVDDTAVCTDANIAVGGSVRGCPDVHNLMFPILADPTAAVTAKQGRVIRLNPGVSP